MDTRARASYAANWTTEGTSGEKTVTEAEWMNCMDAPLMVDFLCRGRGFTATLKWMMLGWEGRHRRDRPRIRKLRLFTCACCRRIWHLLRDERSREAVAVAEVYADKG